MGTRPLRRTIQREIEDVLSEQILLNELHAGQIVVIDCEGDPSDPGNAHLIFTTSEVPCDAALMVTHAGHGSVLEALAAGVPVVCCRWDQIRRTTRSGSCGSAPGFG